MMSSIWFVTERTESSFSACQKHRAGVDRDHDVSAHRAHRIDGQAAREAAIDEGFPCDAIRGKSARHRHARAHRFGEIAVIEDDFFAGLDVGGERAERDGQMIEIVDSAHRQREFAQIHEQLTAREQTFGQLDLEIAGEPERDVLVELEVARLAPERIRFRGAFRLRVGSANRLP